MGGSNKNETLLREFKKELEAIKTKAQEEGRLVYSDTGAFEYALAPNGNRSNLNERQWLHVQSGNFKNWFGESKVLDENDEPLIVYHGSNKSFKEFKHQDKDKIDPFWFGLDKEGVQRIAEGVVESKGGSSAIYSCFLKIVNPWTPDKGLLNSNSDVYDGLINSVDGVISVKNASQIKSAENNNGLYSKDSNNMNE